jgi:molybdopterin-containing oxidoreductase family iron-sulfur binding subunit
MNDDLGRMVLNPDVNVRSRGLWKMFNVYSNDTATILNAKRRGRVVDGEFQTACSNACSNGAMAFGDVNDKGMKLN